MSFENKKQKKTPHQTTINKKDRHKNDITLAETEHHVSHDVLYYNFIITLPSPTSSSENPLVFLQDGRYSTVQRHHGPEAGAA